MINLIASSQLSELKAARRNVTLLNFNILTVIACFITLAILAGTYLFLAMQYGAAQAALETATSEKGKIAGDIKRVNDFKEDLAAAKTILSGDITLSNLAIILTDSIPQGVVVDTLAVDPTSLTEIQTITIFARSANDAITIKQQFNDSRYITNAFIQDVTDQSTMSGISYDPARPFRVTLVYKYDIANIIADTKKRTEEGR